MTKISDTKGRTDGNSGYTRLVGNAQLGILISRVHATSIRHGNALEKSIESEIPALSKTTVDQVRSGKDAFAAAAVPRYQAVFAHRLPPVVKESAKVRGRGSAIDLVIFDHQERGLILVELKDGDTFDTKKSGGELASLEAAAERLQELTGYVSRYAFCAFNQTSRDAIVHGSKRYFTHDQVMTGRELCDLLSVDYDALRHEREVDQPENLSYFVSELIEIDEVRTLIREALDSHDRDQGRKNQ